MADLIDPTYHVTYRCGCTWQDTTPHDGVVVPVHEDLETGETVPERPLSKTVAFRFNRDALQLGQLYRQALREQSDGTLDREELIKRVEKFLGRNLGPAAKGRLRGADAAGLKVELFDGLLTVDHPVSRRTQTDPQSGKETIHPVYPVACPRHTEAPWSVHGNYLNPADGPARAAAEHAARGGGP